jgi:hypothetical protein
MHNDEVKERISQGIEGRTSQSNNDWPNGDKRLPWSWWLASCRRNRDGGHLASVGQAVHRMAAAVALDGDYRVSLGEEVVRPFLTLHASMHRERVPSTPLIGTGFVVYFALLDTANADDVARAVNEVIQWVSFPEGASAVASVVEMSGFQRVALVVDWPAMELPALPVDSVELDLSCNKSVDDMTLTSLPLIQGLNLALRLRAHPAAEPALDGVPSLLQRGLDALIKSPTSSLHFPCAGDLFKWVEVVLPPPFTRLVREFHPAMFQEAAMVQLEALRVAASDAQLVGSLSTAILNCVSVSDLQIVSGAYSVEASATGLMIPWWRDHIVHKEVLSSSAGPIDELEGPTGYSPGVLRSCCCQFMGW